MKLDTSKITDFIKNNTEECDKLIKQGDEVLAKKGWYNFRKQDYEGWVYYKLVLEILYPEKLEEIIRKAKVRAKLWTDLSQEEKDIKMAKDLHAKKLNKQK